MFTLNEFMVLPYLVNTFSVFFHHSAIAFPSQSLRLVFQAFEVFVYVLTYDGSP